MHAAPSSARSEEAKSVDGKLPCLALMAPSILATYVQLSVFDLTPQIPFLQGQ